MSKTKTRKAHQDEPIQCPSLLVRIRGLMLCKRERHPSVEAVAHLRSVVYEVKAAELLILKVRQHAFSLIFLGSTRVGGVAVTHRPLATDASVCKILIF